MDIIYRKMDVPNVYNGYYIKMDVANVYNRYNIKNVCT
jgi:hypothetical protein